MQDCAPDIVDCVVKDCEEGAGVYAYDRCTPHLRDCVIENYKDQVKDKTNTATCVSSNTAFGKHNIPYTTLADGKIVPTLKHKFFETDLPFGLVTFKDIATMLGG